jgi:D-alanyl-D-alanine carboxypeptidase
MNLNKILDHNLAQVNSFSLRKNITSIGLVSLFLFFSVSFILHSFFHYSLLTSLSSISQAESVQASEIKQEQVQKEASNENKSQIYSTTKPKSFPKKITKKDLPNFEAKSVLVKDHKTGKILLKKTTQTQRPLASITKLMSALVFLETNPDWGEKVRIVKNDIVGPHVDQGEVYTIEELWSAALIGSSNKSILTLAESVNWPKQAFIQRMNQKAVELGMDNTYFAGTTGLKKKNVSTAEDITILLDEALKYKKIQTALATDEYTIDYKKNNHHIWNTDWLLLGWIPNDFTKIFGGKTGYIEAAGYNFTVQLSKGEGRVLDIVVLGANSHEARFTVARDAAEWVYQNYVWSDSP